MLKQAQSRQCQETTVSWLDLNFFFSHVDENDPDCYYLNVNYTKRCYEKWELSQVTASVE